jgi:putative hydrolase of the HAD superfamily
MKPEAVTFDIGGIIYSDDVFKNSILGALREMVDHIDEIQFERVYLDHLKSQQGSLRNKLCQAFLGSLDHKDDLMARATKRWIFTENDLYTDAKNCIEMVRGNGCKVGIVANQATSVLDALTRDAISPLIDFLGVSAIVGVEKPDARIFQMALEQLGSKPALTVHVGNRIDTDVIPAQQLGMRTAWIMRGEANPEPTQSDLELADIALPSLVNLPQAIAVL